MMNRAERLRISKNRDRELESNDKYRLNESRTVSLKNALDPSFMQHRNIYIYIFIHQIMVAWMKTKKKYIHSLRRKKKQ